MGLFRNLVVLSSFLHLLYADFQVDIHLASYVNTKHSLKSGFCCDRSSSKSSCQDPCDNQFTFCLRPTGVEEGNYCPINGTIYETTSSISDNIVFQGESIDEGVPNPLVFTGETWPGVMEFFMRIEDVDSSDDYDSSSNDPLVNTFTIPIIFSGSGSYPTLHRDLQHGSTLRLFYQASCSANYYGRNCSTYCLPRDDDTGHYTCDQHGQIQCMIGYQNPLSNCTECSLAPGCSFTGGYCNSTNHCICRERFTGDNCDECMGGYSGVNCSECKINYTGDKCSVCAARYSGIDCSSCIAGYVGESCSECADGYMTNGNECIKCSQNFAGKNCSSCQVRFSGENCSSCVTGYAGTNCSTCDEGYGGPNCSKCKEGFTGMNCSDCAVGYFGDNCEKYNAGSKNCTICDGVRGSKDCVNCTGDGVSTDSTDRNCSWGNITGSKCNKTGHQASVSPISCRERKNCSTECVDDVANVNCSGCMNTSAGDSCTNGSSPCILEDGRSPCLNRGICVESSNSSNFHCVCPDHFQGPLCEIVVTLCIPNPCKNAGNCQILHNKNETSCSCNDGFWGRYCEKSQSKNIDFFYPFIGICALVGILLLLVIVVLICFICCCCKKKRNKSLRSIENSIPKGDASGYMISALNPFNSSSELDVSVPGLVKITGRKSELFDNPIYDRPSVEIVRSPNNKSLNSQQQEDCPSRNGNILYATKLELSNMDANSLGQNSSAYYERSYDSFHTQPSPCRSKASNHKYEEISIQQEKNKNSKEDNSSRGKETSDNQTEDESMLTVVNASYEALPCHMQSILPKIVPQHNVVLATGQISAEDGSSESLLASLEVPRRKISGYKPTLGVNEQSLEVPSSKSPNQMKSRKS